MWWLATIEEVMILFTAALLFAPSSLSADEFKFTFENIPNLKLSVVYSRQSDDRYGSLSNIYKELGKAPVSNAVIIAEDVATKERYVVHALDSREWKNEVDHGLTVDQVLARPAHAAGSGSNSYGFEIPKGTAIHVLVLFNGKSYSSPTFVL